MELGGFILVGILAVRLFLGVLPLIVAFFRHSSWRWRGLGVWFGGLVILVLLWRQLYQAYVLDEGLFIAAAKGDIAEVKILLSAGASPNAEWEDGTSALSAARRGVTKRWRSFWNAPARPSNRISLYTAILQSRPD
jgi:uncharacterized protein